MTPIKSLMAVSAAFFLAACEKPAQDAMMEGDDAMGTAMSDTMEMSADGGAMADDAMMSN